MFPIRGSITSFHKIQRANSFRRDTLPLTHTPPTHDHSACVCVQVIESLSGLLNNLRMMHAIARYYATYATLGPEPTAALLRS